jgi:flavin reductase (DIM6/NTAB) family NADH-FMN oxidoreductase RutF
MKKILIKKDFWPLVESVIIIGTETDTKQPNFLTCSWHSRVNQRPPQWGITIDHRRHSLDCIRKNKTYSINYPGQDIVKVTDYCGIYSGKKVDKGSLFTIFNGTLNGAPMIEECIVNIELEVKKIIELESDSLIIGEMIHTYSDERYMVNNSFNFENAESFFLTYPDFKYHTIHGYIGKAWNIGKKLD